MAEMSAPLPFTLAPFAPPDAPGALDALAADAAADGLRIPARVAAEWAAGVRFDRPGEALLAGWRGTVLAGIGGITVDPGWPEALRMRRFYVRRDCRRCGLAALLAAALLRAAAGRVVTVNAATPDAPAFWEALGFRPDPAPGRTHLLSP